MWGVDNTLLSAAVDGKVFEPYRSADAGGDRPAAHRACARRRGHAGRLRRRVRQLRHRLVRRQGRRRADVARRPDQAGVQGPPRRREPGTSSPGLAFLLATIAHFGDDGWQDYWKALRANGVKVDDSWTTAYYDDFSGASGSTGDRPLVVSLRHQPARRGDRAAEPPATAPTGVVASTCFRQVEFAGVLRGTKHEAEARSWSTSSSASASSSELPLNLFVYPARTGVAAAGRVHQVRRRARPTR